MDYHVELRRVSRVFTKNAEQIRALDGVDLAIPRGGWTVVVGVSGSGKSTMLGLVGGLDRATEGEVLVGGSDLGMLSSDALADFRREKVGFVFQSFNLIPTFTALENVCLPFIPLGVPREEAESRARAALEQVGMGARANHLPGELSGGEQQRVAIARSLVNEPDIVFADEPTGNLDSETTMEVIDLMKRLHEEKGLTYVIVTHDSTVGHAMERVVLMRNGAIMKSFRPTPT